MVSAAAPLTAVAGGVPLGMLLGSGAGIPGAFLIVTAILLIFAVGYVAMARHVNNAGAFYAFAARGLAMTRLAVARKRAARAWIPGSLGRLWAQPR